MSMTTTQKGKIIKTLLKWKTWNSMTNELSEVKPPKKTTHWIWFLNNPDCLKNRCLTKAVLTSPNWFQWTPSKPKISSNTISFIRLDILKLPSLLWWKKTKQENALMFTRPLILMVLVIFLPKKKTTSPRRSMLFYGGIKVSWLSKPKKLETSKMDQLSKRKSTVKSYPYPSNQQTLTLWMAIEREFAPALPHSSIPKSKFTDKHKERKE